MIQGHGVPCPLVPESLVPSASPWSWAAQSRSRDRGPRTRDEDSGTKDPGTKGPRDYFDYSEEVLKATTVLAVSASRARR